MPTPYDLELFLALNAEHAAAPLVPAPPERTTASFEQVARKRLETLSRYVDVRGKRVLELGTGRGYTAALLVGDGGATHVTGIDVRRYPDWDAHDPDRVELLEGDLASEPLVEDGSVDVVVSAVVFEHVTRPVAMLEALHRVLAPGGVAWLYFNLHRGPKASHRYRQITFPWPHLLFDEDVARAALVELGGRGTFAWVNRLTAGDYLQACGEIGFEVVEHRRHVTRLEDHLGFLERFDDVLGRYPALDLETDFLTLSLRRADGPVDRLPLLGYAARQRALDDLRAHRRAASG